MLTAIILTFNEERHLERCLSSLNGICDKIIIVDSGSTDSTKDIGLKFGATFIYNKWRNYASQFEYGMNLARSMGGSWCLRIDADEYIDDCCFSTLKQSIQSDSIHNGFFINRSMYFLRRPVKFGAMFPRRMLRIFNVNKAKIEPTWMDEHILVEGSVSFIDISIIDDNVNTLSWWKEKHIDYAKREVIDIYDKRLSVDKSPQTQISFERSVKDRIYLKLPLFLRAFIYFLYRYVVFAGFLDGRIDRNFHFWQGLWYRCVVDLFLFKIKAKVLLGQSLVEALESVTGRKIDFTQK